MTKLSRTYNNIFDSKRINGAASLGAPDPYIYRHNGSYYLTCTRPKGLVLMKSDDLINWKYVNSDGIVSRDKEINSAYAPELSYFDGYFYITASPCGNGHYIWRSTDICGPYELVTDNILELIDGSFFIDSDEKKYFLRATETGIAAKRFKDSLEESDFPLFSDDSFYFTDTIIGNWTEGPYMLKRYGRYYLTYTGTHFLSDAYRVDYSSGTSFTENGLKFKDTTLLSTTNEFYGLGHSMTFLGPNLDSYYIAYHNRVKSGNRYLNISRLVFDNHGNMMTNGVFVKNNPAIERPYFETRISESNYVTDEVFSNKRCSIEYNFKGPNIKLYLSYKDDNNHQYIALNGSLKIIDVKNGIEEILLEYKLNTLGNPTVFHSIRCQYFNKRITIYLDNVEIIHNFILSLRSGKIGFANNELLDSYLAYSLDAFGSSDVNTVKKEQFYVNNCLLKNDNYHTKFEVSLNGIYMLYLHSTKSTMLNDITVDGKHLLDEFESTFDNDLILEVPLEKGVHSISFKCNKVSDDLKIKIVKKEDNPIITINNLLENSNIYWRYQQLDKGIYLENDRNAILSKNRYHAFELSTELDLIGNPIIKDRFVGLVACCNNYATTNEFENGYSLMGYLFVLDRNYAYVIDANYYHSKVLKKIRLEDRKNELKVIKTLNCIKFYLNDNLVYITEGNKYISGYCGIYNYHVSAIFRNFSLKEI